MTGKWTTLVVVVGFITTLLNLAMLSGQISSSAAARTASSASKLLDDDEFTSALTKIIRKTVRDYCTVGKRNAIDC
jgi:hypothetical protein